MTASSAFRSEAVARPRFDSGPTSTRVIASATGSGVCVPPGPSKWAIPEVSEGKRARRAAVSRATPLSSRRG